MRHMWGMTELAPMGSVAGLKVPTACAPPFDRLVGTRVGNHAFFRFCCRAAVLKGLTWLCCVPDPLAGAFMNMSVHVERSLACSASAAMHQCT